MACIRGTGYDAVGTASSPDALTKAMFPLREPSGPGFFASPMRCPRMKSKLRRRNLPPTYFLTITYGRYRTRRPSSKFLPVEHCRALPKDRQPRQHRRLLFRGVQVPKQHAGRATALRRAL